MSAVVSIISGATPSERGQQLAQALLQAFLASVDVGDKELALEFFTGFHAITLSYAAGAIGADAAKAMVDALVPMLQQNELLATTTGGRA